MTNFKEFKNKVINGGIQYLAFFSNGYGVSIVQHDYSYGHDDGLWEIAVIKGDLDKWKITYDTSITDNVLGHLTEDEVNEIIDKVIAL